MTDLVTAEPVRVGVIGTGVMGGDHARNLAAGIRGASLVALADASLDRARALAGELGIDDVRPDGEELIGSGRVDAVIVAAPDPAHAGLVGACLDAGLPVLCEKPLAPTAGQAGLIVDRQEAAGSDLITVGFMRRFDPGYQALRQRLADDADGALLMTHSVHRNVEAYPGQDSSATITNSGIHEIDVLPWLSGSPIVDVQWACGRASSLIRERHDPQFILMHDAAGVLHTVELGVHLQYGYDVRCETVCERATAELPQVPALVEQAPVVVNAGLARRTFYPEDSRARFAAAYRAELTAWIDGIRSGRRHPDAAGARDGLRAALVAESLPSGSRIPSTPRPPVSRRTSWPTSTAV